MRALVTGATGFVGRYMARLLLNHGYNVCGTYYHVPLSCSDLIGVHLEKIDITDKSSVKRIISNFMPDEIYHLAGVAVTSGVNKEIYYTTNFGGTIILLDVVHEVVPNCRVLVVGSSISYGQVPKECQPIQEDQELRPINHYAASKAAADMAACAYAAEELHVVRARPFNHTGPGQSTGFVCSRLAKLVAEVALGKKDPVIEVGNIESARDFTDVRDVVKAYYLLLLKGRAGEAYNVCKQKAYSIKEIISILTNFAGVDIQIKHNQELLRKSDIPILLGSRKKILADTCWEPDILFEKTLFDIFSYWKQVMSCGGTKRKE
ncbi:GDP-mannose 4,6-dehydratase [Pelotomaculum terephthalicicum JT]|uniref:GDP-mannose 4,6-dehydratase n=1 Tax=Pelotomaculum terephthalicicum TaxID=206393 RepID=UPI001F03FC24|nr:GDP-mannose 4,6-dehydratase [Pelotomaculum terephthalicicum]MCG9966635.1 GDP-mannose 4,6-dehydratase [Pelotomaculum terephthalicicum JT]